MNNLKTSQGLNDDNNNTANRYRKSEIQQKWRQQKTMIMETLFNECFIVFVKVLFSHMHAQTIPKLIILWIFWASSFPLLFPPEYHSFILFSISNFNEPYIHRHLSKPLLLYLHFLDQFGFHLHFLLLHSHLILLCQPLISPLLKWL